MSDGQVVPREIPQVPPNRELDLDTRHMVFEMQRDMGALLARVDILISDRATDRDERRQERRDLRDDMTKAQDAIRTDFNKFVESDFRPLRDDVSKLRNRMAWAAGAAAIGSAVLTALAKKLGY